MAKIIWLTGLSGSGKTTLCNKIKKNLNKKYKCLIIDGDKFRKKNKQFSFSKKNIIKNNLNVINYIKKNLEKYDYILVSVISPLKKTREYAFKIFKQNYYEVYVYASIKTLLERDTKGLYNLAKRGLVKTLIGYKSKINYELSNHKYLRINTKTLSTYSCIKKVLKYTKTID